MKFHLLPVCLVAALFAPLLHAGDFTACDMVAKKVHSEVEVEPAKVLLIVENAMVNNEECACEIVKAAILASHANEELTKQIMLTATNVAPNKAGLISECANAMLAAMTSAAGGKEVKQVIAVQPDPPPSTPDYKVAPADIRGVYLIQPAAGGVVIKKEDNPKRPPPPPRNRPMSPSKAKLK